MQDLSHCIGNGKLNLDSSQSMPHFRNPCNDVSRELWSTFLRKSQLDHSGVPENMEPGSNGTTGQSGRGEYLVLGQALLLMMWKLLKIIFPCQCWTSKNHNPIVSGPTGQVA